MKTFHKIIFVVSVFLLPLCVPAQDVKSTKTELIGKENGELTSKDILQDRDISLYDQAGHFDCRGWAPDKQPRGVCDEKKVRDFIWQHWTDKKRGYLRITYNSVDAVSTSHIFIEPDEKGNWYIARRIVRWHALPGLSHQIDDILGLIAVERVEGKRKDDWSIVIKRSTGKIVYTIPE